MNTFYFLCISSLLFFSCENNPNVEIPVPDNTHIQHENKPTGDISTSDNTHVQKNEGSYTYDIAPSISYTDSDEAIYNPDIGFYNFIFVRAKPKIEGEDGEGILNINTVKSKIDIQPTFIENTQYNKNATFNLVHLRVDISRFSKNKENSKLTNDVELDKKTLDDIAKVLTYLKDNNKTAIIRFAYDDGFNGKNTEPASFEIILRHIEQLCSVLKNHTQVLTAIECGMIGPWGEMHTSDYAKQKDGFEDGYITEIMKAWLDGLSGFEVPLLVRQPQFIYSYVRRYCGISGATGIPNYTVNKNAPEYRLGLYNDGYLGTSSDYGTFRIDRKNEIAWLKQFTNHTPYRGELLDYIESGETPYWESALQDAANEMYDVHLSYLNIGWNNHVFTWADSDDSSYEYTYDEGQKTRSMTVSNRVGNEKFFTYMLKRMGYRYAINAITSSFEQNNFNIKLTIQNTGFANLPYHRKKYIQLILQDDKNQFIYSEKIIFTGQSEQNEKQCEINFQFSNDQIVENMFYTVYIKICDTDESYPIKLSNENCWDESLKANKIGTLKKTHLPSKT